MPVSIITQACILPLIVIALNCESTVVFIGTATDWSRVL